MQSHVACHEDLACLHYSISKNKLAVFIIPQCGLSPGHRCLELPLTRSLPHNKLTWTELARCWRKAFLQTYLEHTLPWQNGAISLSLPSIIMHTNDARKNRRPKANSISPRRKRKPSIGFCYECLTSEILCE